MNEQQLQRYGRHISLAGFGLEGQERLRAARVLLVGLGGLGSPIAMYLAASGVGELVLTDFDTVELSNLQRQIVHNTDEVGANKVDSAARTIARLNPEVKVDARAWSMEESEFLEEAGRADVIVDACDSFATRFELNRASLATRTPLVSGAALRYEGQVSVFDPRSGDGPCYRCLYADVGAAEGEPCSQVGVLAPLLGIVGSIQATEAIKIMTGIGATLSGKVIVIDAHDGDIRTLRLRKDPACPACSSAPADGAPPG